MRSDEIIHLKADTARRPKIFRTSAHRMKIGPLKQFRKLDDLASRGIWPSPFTIVSKICRQNHFFFSPIESSHQHSNLCLNNRSRKTEKEQPFPI